MLQDTERLQYLLDEAYGANGASAVQFEKTQESVAAKTNKLKNAWDEFAMGVMNEKLFKGFVDFGREGLSQVNDIIEGISLKIEDFFGKGSSLFPKLLMTGGLGAFSTGWESS